jgi:hypothetical protein
MKKFTFISLLCVFVLILILKGNPEVFHSEILPSIFKVSGKGPQGIDQIDSISMNYQAFSKDIPPFKSSISNTSPLITPNTNISPAQSSDFPPKPVTKVPSIIASNFEEQQIIVPAGARLPAALVDSSGGLSPQQAEVLDSISEEFLDSALSAQNHAGDAKNTKVAEENWSKSLNEANDRYRALFGVDAFNARTIQAAKEALSDKSK